LANRATDAQALSRAFYTSKRLLLLPRRQGRPAKLYFAFPDTLHNRLPATTIAADYVSELMEASPARRIVLPNGRH
jgi:hypothetical protein